MDSSWKSYKYPWEKKGRVVGRNFVFVRFSFDTLWCTSGVSEATRESPRVFHSGFGRLICDICLADPGVVGNLIIVGEYSGTPMM